MACEDIVDEFNDLRSDIILLYDLKNALNSAEYEFQTALHRLRSENGSTQSTGTNSHASMVRLVHARSVLHLSLFSNLISYCLNRVLQRTV